MQVMTSNVKSGWYEHWYSWTISYAINFQIHPEEEELALKIQGEGLGI